ncbi:hypothetical protein CR194_19540 [Salipaludibacillus keqinensis]|uniref:Inhibitor of sigma-G Gin n=1 Tax=Salipaludibacillus keqinensis TaxID=2045207 RepID=A0A323T4A7_9BACI|nr:sigma factor G inhibitor Gin [Salipaludibacillus keqinensis]PYZ91528.1 hypothetical protein CR194_19540 [Salipaludibacillus keqinensis]
MKQLLNENIIRSKDCLICSAPKDKGIHLAGAFICDECERNIVQAEVGERRYAIYIDRLKKVRNELCERIDEEVPR